MADAPEPENRQRIQDPTHRLHSQDIYTGGWLVRAAIAMLPGECGPELAASMARTFPGKGR